MAASVGITLDRKTIAKRKNMDPYWRCLIIFVLLPIALSVRFLIDFRIVNAIYKKLAVMQIVNMGGCGVDGFSLADQLRILYIGWLLCCDRRNYVISS